nr:hypothetical protein [Streptomyces sp. I6]
MKAVQSRRQQSSGSRTQLAVHRMGSAVHDIDAVPPLGQGTRHFQPQHTATQDSDAALHG